MAGFHKVSTLYYNLLWFFLANSSTVAGYE
jgi:hypothetical protein